jgi:hypothetical protein
VRRKSLRTSQFSSALQITRESWNAWPELALGPVVKGHGDDAGFSRQSSRLLGRKTERMMRRYAAVTDQTLRAAVEAVSGSEGVSANRHALLAASPSSSPFTSPTVASQPTPRSPRGMAIC